MAWKRVVKVKNKNCKSIREIDTRLRGRYAKDSYTPYRAVVNALVGGGIPEIGRVEVEAIRLQGITRLYISKDEVVYLRRGELKRRKVTGLQSNLSHLYKAIELELKEEIRHLEGMPESPEQEMELYIKASKYRDVQEKRERVAPNETRRIVNVVDLPGMTDLVELVIDLNSFGKLERLSPQDQRMVEGYQSMYGGVIKEEYKEEILAAMTIEQRLPKGLVRVGIINEGIEGKYDYLKEVIKENQEGQTTVVYKPNREMLMADMLDMRVIEALERFSVYNGYLEDVEDMCRVHIDYERRLWADNLNHTRIKGVVDEEYKFFKEQGRKAYSEPVPLQALVMFNKESLNRPDLVEAIRGLQDFTPLYSRDNRQTIKSVGMDRETREGIGRYKVAVERLENMVKAVIDALNGVFVSTMVDLTTGDRENWSVQQDRIPAVLAHGEFYYTENILEAVNRIQRYEDGVERGSAYYKTTKVAELLEKVNPVKLPEDITEKEKILEGQVGRIIADFVYLTDSVRNWTGLPAENTIE